MATSKTSWGDTMKRLRLIFGICVLLVVGCQPGGAVRDYSDAVAVDLAVATMTGRAPQPNPPGPYDCPRCKDTGWITHGDGHRTPCPDCSDGSSGPYGGPLDTWRDAKDLIRKGNELADRSKALFDRAERDGKISVDIRLPKPNLPSQGPVQKGPVTKACPGGICPRVPEYPKRTAIPPVTQPATPSCGSTYCRPRVFWRWRR